MNRLWITLALLFSNFCRTDSIQTRIHRPIRFVDERAFPSRHFRQIDPSSANATPLDWEHGLREATLQALFREHWGDGNLRKHIYSAPLLGKQDKATPFGDIAILARGQLYAHYAGFIFVQDPYQNDCDECHNIEADDNARRRCITHHCQIWQPKNNEKLIALWTVKRIRHRSREDSPQYEVEFGISPIGLGYQNEGYLTKEGTFNYDLPGHVFILKTTDTRHHSERVQNIDYPQNGFFIAQTPDGRKYVLHSFNGLPTPEAPRHYGLPPKYAVPTSTSSTTQYEEEDEKKLYETLLDVLHRKTSPDSTRFTPPLQPTTTLSDKTLVQFPDGQVVPITELETPFVTRTTPGYVAVRFPESNGIPTKPGMHKTSQSATVTEGTSTSRITKGTDSSSSRVTPQSYGIMMPQTMSVTHRTTAANVANQQLTTRHRTPVSEHYTTVNEVPHTPSVEFTKPSLFYTTHTTEHSNQGHQTIDTSTSSTTKPPLKMTFHFFAAEEAKKTTPKQPPSTVQQEDFTEYENSLSDPLVPTKASLGATSEDSITKTSTTAKISRPATIVKVTKPLEPSTTDSLSTIWTASKTSASSTSIALEPATSQNPSTFKLPIVVLDENTVEPTTKKDTVKYPTTQYQQVYTITPSPKTTYIEYATPEGTTKYPSTIAMEKITSSEQGTTSFQADIGTTGSSSGESTLQSTIYTRIPTLESLTGLIETTRGVTKIMGTSQNKTTEMVYYAAEEIDDPGKETSQYSVATPTGQGTKVPLAGTEPTFTILETKTSPTTPKRIVTTIRADGSVFVKTTPITADEELFGKTKSSTKEYKVTQPSEIKTTAGPSDFLINSDAIPDPMVPLYKKTVKDYGEDDIFGATKDTTAKTFDKIGPVKHYTKSDLEEALFDTNNRKSKALFRRKSSTTEPPANVIYSDFFEASTIPMTTVAQATTAPISRATLVAKDTASVSRGTLSKVRPSFSVSNRKKAGPVTTESVPMATTTALDKETPTHVKPVTSQSYLTSISYEVNKRKILSNGNANEKTQKKVDRTFDVNENQPATESGAFLQSHDDFAFRLVGNARGVEYLDRIGTTEASTRASTSAKTTKKTKYTRRRSYTPKAKRPTRKKLVLSKEISTLNIINNNK